MNNWINIGFYQATWLAAIAGAARGWWWAGPAMLAVFAAWQLSVSNERRADLEVMACAAIAGFAVDTLCVRGGIFTYAAPVPSPDFAPIWIVALWMSFALTLNHSLTWLKAHLALASVLGAVGAPLAYLAAARGWNALSFAARPALALGALAIAWAILAPTLFYLARHLVRKHRAPPVLHGALR
ncbi:MAG: DUF2878 domain-containing protein [Proteobacteria bacterium]|nr:DUF2878 domain-containing protein [Pseudomonadota bacterium]HMM56690.1 DUF2878 domain-containing protein [Rudaea sp.]